MMSPETVERIFRLASHPETPDHEALAAIRKLRGLGPPKPILDQVADLKRSIELLNEKAALEDRVRTSEHERYRLDKENHALKREIARQSDEIARLKNSKRLAYVERLEQRVADRDREILDLERELHGVRERTSPLAGFSCNDFVAQ